MGLILRIVNIPTIAKLVLKMLLGKMGALRESGLDLYAFFIPEMHSNKSVVSLFANIADEIIKL